MIEAGEAERYFPGAPPDAWISEEGWLIIDDEAWTVDEWKARARWITGRKIKYNDEKHVRDRERKRRRRLREDSGGGGIVVSSLSVSHLVGRESG